MRLPVAVCLCLILPSVALAQAAPQAVPQPLQIGPSGQAYLKAIRFQGIDADVGYFDPAGALPPLDPRSNLPKPAPKDQEAQDWTPGRWSVLALALVLLIGLGVLVARNGGGFALALRATAPGAARRAGPGARVAAAGAGAPDLRAIEATEDRRLALLLLARAALARAIAAEGVLAQPSWTLRDALHRLPGSQPHLAALRALVQAGERAFYGNRAVSEAEFQDHLRAARPLILGAGG